MPTAPSPDDAVLTLSRALCAGYRENRRDGYSAGPIVWPRRSLPRRFLTSATPSHRYVFNLLSGAADAVLRQEQGWPV